MVAQGKTKRHYTLQNYGTKKYYCPQAVLLDTVRTSATPCEIRIENASEKLGYFLFANYDDDYLGDVPEPVDYMVLDVQGNVIRKGFGAEIPASFVNSGVYLLKFNGKIQKIRL